MINQVQLAGKFGKFGELFVIHQTKVVVIINNPFAFYDKMSYGLFVPSRFLTQGLTGIDFKKPGAHWLNNYGNLQCVWYEYLATMLYVPFAWIG